MKRSKIKESVAVIGGGFTGIAVSIELAKTSRFQVTLLERERKLGGLSSYHRWQDLTFDRFYHVILPSDANLLDFIKDLNLEAGLFWRETKSGFYKEGQLVSLSSALDFARFPFLSLWQKLRMALGIFRSARIKEPSKLDRLNAQQWLTKVIGLRVYESIWEPLLRSKLGDAAEKTSAAFIWATIRRLYSSRSIGRKREKMGYVHGGYCTILNTAKKKLSELNVKVVTDSKVMRVKTKDNFSHFKRIEPKKNANSYHRQGQFEITTESAHLEFDKVVFTVPSSEVLQILDQPNGELYWQHLRQVEYLGVICVSLILDRKLSPYYVIYLLDKGLPFTGIIEFSNIVSPEHFRKRHFVYLPKYVPKDDPLCSYSDDQILELFVNKLKSVFPDLRDEEILHSEIFREKDVQALQDLNFLDRKIGFRTPIPNLYLANSSMIYDSTLNNNAVINLAQKAAKKIISDSERMEEIL